MRGARRRRRTLRPANRPGAPAAVPAAEAPHGPAPLAAHPGETGLPRDSLPRIFLNRRFLTCVFTGFSSGLPLYVLVNLMSAWLRDGGVDLKAIGLLTLVQLPYAWKFLWAPLCDRYGGRLGRRRSWLLATQLAMLLLLPAFGWLSPREDLPLISALAFALALLSATQDIAIDAFRRQLLLDSEQGLGNVIHVNAYKIASLVPGSLSLILADHLSWQAVYAVTALFMLPGIAMTLTVAEPPSPGGTPGTLRAAMVDPLREFLGRRGAGSALAILTFIVLYKLGDSLATALLMPFYLDLGYSKTEIGLVAKNAGLWASVAGGFVGGFWLDRIGIQRALWIFGVVQAVVILGFAWLATAAHSLTGLALVIAAESFGMGLGTAASVAFVATTTHPTYAATQFALFSGLGALPRTLANAVAGYLVEGGDLAVLGHTLFHLEPLGWQRYFWLCFLLALPGLALLPLVAPWGGGRSRGRAG